MQQGKALKPDIFNKETLFHIILSRTLTICILKAFEITFSIEW